MGIVRGVLYGSVAIAIAACASPPGIVPTAGGKYIVTKEAPDAATTLLDLRTEAARDADRFCAEQRKFMHVEGTEESDPPAFFGQRRRVATTFRCS